MFGTMEWSGIFTQIGAFLSDGLVQGMVYWILGVALGAYLVMWLMRTARGG